MKKILVTGAAGLIGSHLVDILLETGEYQVIGVDDLRSGNIDNLKYASTNSNFKFFHRSIQEFYKTMQRKSSLDCIFHLATLKKTFDGVDVDPSDVMFNSATMASTISNLAIQSDAFLVFSSTSDVYSNSNTFDEDDALTIGPPNISRYSYAMTKLWEEQLYCNLMQEDYIQGSVARIFGCTSSRASRTWSGGHIPLFITKAMNNEDIVIHGDGSQTRSMSHASTIATALYRMYVNRDKTNGEIINLGSKQEVSVKDAAEMIIRKTNSNSKIVYISKEDVFGKYPEIKRRWANTSKASELLDMKFEDTLDEIVNEMITAWNLKYPTIMSLEK